MRRRPAFLAVFLLATTVLLADEKLTVTIKEYVKEREASASRQAFERAWPRFKAVKLGMHADEFFAQMEMLVIRDKKGRGIDGFLDGQLPIESVNMTKGKEPDHYVVFGWYEEWKKSKGAVKKFYVVFRDNVLREIAFFDAKDDVNHQAGKVPE